ncbi:MULTISPECIES: hypothetical protein [Methanobacterium]|jgi:hypothetical protein|uniref:Uncharacterized protein n=1 Tax=Methanobacterium congolense TaxID=118062 RepID=A0A1D3L104_9EURY|nr:MULTISPECIES: hypothetical protein [Methanobacterium]KUK74452.1 MAG: hypothetical protein XD90_1199 [Methanobacterium sp. 42_16]SCG85233.1 putative protein [Methanobacterium congolense]
MILEPGLLSIIQYAAIGVGIANVCLLLGLFYIYWNSYRDMKSEFTIGLLFFTLVLLVQNVAATVFLVLLNFTVGGGGELEEAIEHLLELFSINLIQFVALSILFKITY